MRGWRAVTGVGLALMAGTVAVAGLLQFLAPDVAYHVNDRTRAADDLLAGAEQDTAADLLDADGIDSIPSMHQLCLLAASRRLSASSAA